MSVTERDLKIGLEIITEGVEPAPTSPALVAMGAGGDEYGLEAAGVAAAARRWTGDPGVQGIGIADKVSAGRPTGDLSIAVYVDRKRPLAELTDPVPGEVVVPGAGSVPTDVVEIGVVDKELHRVRDRPCMPGCGVGHPAVTVGTFGAVVRSRGASRGQYILSNSHVLADEGAGGAGDPIVQPGVADDGIETTDTVARLSRWVPFDFTETGFPNVADAAIAWLPRSSDVTAEMRLLGTVPPGHSTYLRRGMHVRKVGRTTDLTTGIVLDTDFRLALTYKRPGGGTGRVGFRDQVLCTRYTARGDSGAAVLNSSGKVVGLHFAGSDSASIFNPIGPVLDLLDVDIVTVWP